MGKGVGQGGREFLILLIQVGPTRPHFAPKHGQLSLLFVEVGTLESTCLAGSLQLTIALLHQSITSSSAKLPHKSPHVDGNRTCCVSGWHPIPARDST